MQLGGNIYVHMSVLALEMSQTEYVLDTKQIPISCTSSYKIGCDSNWSIPRENRQGRRRSLRQI